jgi:8-oxo-dGTP pyrophosphatase MutT (NUDIX family)
MASPEARAGAIVRPAARVLLLDPLGRVLLLRVERPYGLPYAAWLTPGGGLEPGESHEEAALRELREETGISGVELGPWVWERRFHFSRGVVYCNLERY